MIWPVSLLFGKKPPTIRKSTRGMRPANVRPSLEVLEDRTAPAGLTVSITSPANGSFTNNNHPMLAATASDLGGPGVASVQFQYSVAGGTTWHNVGPAEAGGPFSVTFPTSLADGSYQVRAIATDNAGNSAISNYSQTPLVLAAFNGTNGANPEAGLVEDTNGNLFGTTAYNADASGDGTVFEVAAGSGAITILASFNYSNGSHPFAGLVEDRHGNLFGTTSQGGAYGYGTVFEVVAGSGTITTLASCNYANGADSYAGLFEDSGGNLFGTTSAGGTSGDGTVFEVVAGSGTITTLATFNGPNGNQPLAGLIEDSHGNLFGTTAYGGLFGDGTVFELATGSSIITTLASFQNGANGAFPLAGLIEDSSGNLFGTAQSGGATGDGTVFELATGSSITTTLASFHGAHGTTPKAGLIEDSHGNLFGTTAYGGVSGYGTVFEVAAGTDSIITLASFNASSGSDPLAGLIEDGNGNLFGTASNDNGSNHGGGTVFELASTPTAFTIDTVAPVLGGITTSTSITDKQTATPFSNITITDADNPPQTQTVKVVLDNAAKGTLSNLGGFVHSPAGTYTFTGTAANAQTAIRGLIFTPTQNRVVPNLIEDTTFTITANDGVDPDVTNNLTVVHTTSVNDAPVLGGVTSTSVTSFITAGLNNPVGMAFDSHGNLYIANITNNTVSKVLAGTSTAVPFITSGLSNPAFLAFDTHDNLYIANDGVGNNTVSKVAVGTTTAQPFIVLGLNRPVSLAFDANGNLFIGDEGNTVSKVAAGTSTATPFIATGLNKPFDLAFDHLGNLYIANVGSATVSKVAAGTSTATPFITGLPSTDGLAFDQAGNLFIANRATNRVSVVPASANTATSFLASGLNQPIGLAFDSNGNLFIANEGDSTVSKSMAIRTQIDDKHTAMPFAAATIHDADSDASPSVQSVTVTVTLDTAAKGTLAGTGFTQTGPNTGIYTFTGTAALAQADLRTLVFTPTQNRVAPTTTEDTILSVKVDDGIANVTNSDTIRTTSVNDPPVLGGITALTTTNDKSTATLFTAMTIADADSDASPSVQNVTVTVRLDTAAKGTLAGTGFTQTGLNTGIYTFTGTAALAQTRIRALVFTPTQNRRPHGQTENTTFTVKVNDGFVCVSNANTIVRTTSVNDKPNPVANKTYNMLVNANAAHTSLSVAASIGLLAGATDPENDVLTVSLVAAPTKGTFSFNAATGAFSYVPPLNYVGPVTFTYRTFDGELYSDPITVTINVALPIPSPWRRVRGDPTLLKNLFGHS